MRCCPIAAIGIVTTGPEITIRSHAEAQSRETAGAWHDCRIRFGVVIVQELQGASGEHDPEAERSVESILLDDADLNVGTAPLEQVAQIERRRPCTEDGDAHRGPSRGFPIDEESSTTFIGPRADRTTSLRLPRRRSQIEILRFRCTREIVKDARRCRAARKSRLTVVPDCPVKTAFASGPHAPE